MEINILQGILLSMFSGLSTAIGAIISFIFGSRGNKFLSYGLGLSAGVMVYISLVEIIPHSNETAGKILSFFGFL
ncbi:MAG: zinc transporter ZupT, partial [bacterium]|nr:zinc transporter ZupT [bacterium]